MKEYYLRCISCSKTFKPEKGLYTCDKCGDIEGTLEVIYDYDNISFKKNYNKRASMFQFEDLLPINKFTKLDEFVGGTPLILFKLYERDVLIKFDGVSLSGSYKDRASSIAINMALNWNYDTIFCASTGNAASSLSVLSAPTNLKTNIFVPASIPKGKLSQLMAAGANIYLIEASYDDVFDISLDIGLKRNWFSRHSAINPYLLEGKKTAAFEIIIQNDYKSPDYCFVGVGDGTIISSLCKGFKELYNLNAIDKIPKVIGVQSNTAATLKHVFEKKEPFKAKKEKVFTIADSISVGNPRDVIKACKYLKENGGFILEVSDKEIIDAIIELTSKTGVFSEPAGAISFAGFKKMIQDNLIKENEVSCLVVTGNGLKDINAIIQNDELKVYSKKDIIKAFEE